MKLEDINKKNIHSVPDNYFEELPLKIQLKLNQPEETNSWFITYGVRYALPALLLVAVIAYLITKPDMQRSPEDLLAEVSTNELIYYLEESEITTEEIIETIELSTFDFDFENDDTEIVKELDLSDSELDALIHDFETDDI